MDVKKLAILSPPMTKSFDRHCTVASHYIILYYIAVAGLVNCSHLSFIYDLRLPIGNQSPPNSCTNESNPFTIIRTVLS